MQCNPSHRTNTQQGLRITTLNHALAKLMFPAMIYTAFGYLQYLSKSTKNIACKINLWITIYVQMQTDAWIYQGFHFMLIANMSKKNACIFPWWEYTSFLQKCSVWWKVHIHLIVWEIALNASNVFLFQSNLFYVVYFPTYGHWGITSLFLCFSWETNCQASTYFT